MTKLGKLWRKIRQEDRKKMEKTDREIKADERKAEKSVGIARVMHACPKRRRRNSCCCFLFFFGYAIYIRFDVDGRIESFI